MSLKKLADEAVKQINKSIGDKIDEQDIAVVSSIIQDALVEAVNESSRTCSTAAVVCCGPDADLAHKIAEDVERKRYALLANLLSMR
jgi:hypothetical protein